MDELSLRVNSQRFEGWQDVSVSRSLNSASGQFSVSFTDRWSGSGESWLIRAGDECELLINDMTVITGYVDVLETSFDADSRSITVSGRDKTADFIDSSVGSDPTEFLNLTIFELAKRLAFPFGLSVSSLTPLSSTKLATWRVNSAGESAFECLDRAARQYGILVSSTPDGQILLTEPGGMSTNLVLRQGETILSARFSHNVSSRFNTYIVSGQTVGYETMLATDPFTLASAVDPDIRDSRRKFVKAESAATKKSASSRAKWEMVNRKAKSYRYAVTVEGWTKPDGNLWAVNETVTLDSGWLDASNEELLISSIQFALQGAGAPVTTLELELAESYSTQPQIIDLIQGFF